MKCCCDIFAEGQLYRGLSQGTQFLQLHQKDMRLIFAMGEQITSGIYWASVTLTLLLDKVIY